MRWAGHLACIGRKRIRKGLWWRNLKGKTPERRRHRCENNVKMDLLIIGLGDVDWIRLAQGRNR
jgi:hypothetical protein